MLETDKLDVIFDIHFNMNKNFTAELFLSNIVEVFKNPNNIINTPIIDIPLDIRLIDKNLRYQPIKEIVYDGYSVLIGTYSLGIKCDDYKGWDYFKEKILKLLNIVFDKDKKMELNITLEQCGMRYTNFFRNENIFQLDSIKVQIKNESDIRNKHLHLKIIDSIDEENIKSIIILDNRVEIKSTNEVGSVLDIILHKVINKDVFINNKEGILDNMHNYIEKKYSTIIEKKEERD